MPPPSPYNLNKWLIGGSVLLVGAGLLTSLRAQRRGGGFLIEKDTPAADAGVADTHPAAEAALDATGE